MISTHWLRTSLIASALAVGAVIAGAGPARAVSVTDPGCVAGSTQYTFDNTSGIPDSQIFLRTDDPSVVAPTDFLTQGQPLRDPTTQVANFFVTAADPTGHSFYYCLDSSAPNGRLYIAIGGAPSSAPLVSDTYRWGLIEFGPPGGQVDYSNVNNFDFPINLRTYSSPGGSTSAEQALFSGNTCEIVNAMRTAVEADGGSSEWGAVSLSSGGQFVRIISPDNGTTFEDAWPNLTPYINAVATGGPIVVEGDYVGSGTGTPDPADVGWYDYTGTFSGGNLTLTGTVGGAGAPNPGGPAGATMTVPLAALAHGIYNQAIDVTNYTVASPPDAQPNNDLFAKMYNDLTTSFAYSYWGSAYGTGRDTQFFWNPWSPPTLPTNGQAAFPTLGAGFGSAPFNLYAKVLHGYSASYTMPFSENFGDGGLASSPLLDTPVNGEVRMTLPPDGWLNGVSGSPTCVAAASTTPAVPVPTTGTGTPRMPWPPAAFIVLGLTLLTLRRRISRTR
jgi:hypothetical protein